MDGRWSKFQNFDISFTVQYYLSAFVAELATGCSTR